MMQIDWVSILTTVTIGSVIVSALTGVGSLFAYKVMQARQARTAEVVVRKENQ